VPDPVPGLLLSVAQKSRPSCIGRNPEIGASSAVSICDCVASAATSGSNSLRSGEQLQDWHDEHPQAAALECARDNKGLCQEMKLRGGLAAGDEPPGMSGVAHKGLER
jgi:hypothetical protein